MRWRKGTIADNNNSKMVCWRSDEGNYLISQNINHGKEGPRGSKGGWWWEVSRLVNKVETFVGEGPTLKVAKAVAEDDWEMINGQEIT
jgi:hypothetical protein